MSNFTISYSTRRTLIIEHKQTGARIELSPVSVNTANLVEKLLSAIVQMKPMVEIHSLLAQISKTGFEQSISMFFYLWFIDRYQIILADLEKIKAAAQFFPSFPEPHKETEKKYLDSINENLFK